MEHLLIKELIGSAKENDETITLETVNKDHIIPPETPIEYRYGAVMVEDWAIDEKHIISIKRGV